MTDDKFDNQPIMFAVTESELQRFRKIETENTLLKVQIECLEEEIEKLKQQNERLKQDFEKFKNGKVCDTCKYNTVGQDEYISVLEEQYRDCVKQLNEVYNCHFCGCNGCEKKRMLSKTK